MRILSRFLLTVAMRTYSTTLAIRIPVEPVGGPIGLNCTHSAPVVPSL